MLLGLISVTEGEILFQGKPRDLRGNRRKKEYWKNIQAIFQDPFASYNMFKKIDSVLLLSLIHIWVNVNQPGGMIQIDISEDGDIYMTGSVGYVADMRVAESFFS